MGLFKKFWSWYVRPNFSPKTQKIVNVISYGLGRASAAVSHKKAEFKAAGKKWDFSWTVWIWISDFGKGVQMRRKEYRSTSLQIAQVTSPPPVL